MTVYCKFGTALEILTGKWKSLILLRLLINGTMQFSELQKAIPDISKKMLAQQLKELDITILCIAKCMRKFRQRSNTRLQSTDSS